MTSFAQMPRLLSVLSGPRALLVLAATVVSVSQAGCGPRLEVHLDPDAGGAGSDGGFGSSQWPGAPDGATKDPGASGWSRVLCGAPGASCSAQSYCSDEYCGTVEGHGQKANARCLVRPIRCPAVVGYDETTGVRGCDGRAYASECDAHMHGVAAQYMDSIWSPPKCSTNADCPASDFCDFPAGSCSGTGACAPRPQAAECEGFAACYSELGCDGRRYCTACEAARAGVAVVRMLRPCQYGADQTCNEDPAISSIHGRCKTDGLCECDDASRLSVATGRCGPA
ncbi:MAG: hypothetical protein U0169_22340 [Polyangiaceae bacterium]